MVNAWSLLWEEINGTMDETYPIKEKKMTEKPEEPDDYAKLVDHLMKAEENYKEVIGKKPVADFEQSDYRKYQEDKSMRDLSDYISSTYQGHYTNDGSNVQTLDLIHSVGDAESFCRSNAIKYLSRYDKKGQAKRDILKAMHYCLLLYYFSGNTQNETPTRGYETF
jgi:hypothetical protein